MATTPKAKLIAWGIAFGFAGLIACYLGNLDSHRTNFRYLRWKYGWAPQDYKFALHLIMVDPNLRDSMRGKPMDELRSWFPETGPPSPNTPQSEWLSFYEQDPGETYEVVGNTHMGISIINGKFDHIFPMKG